RFRLLSELTRAAESLWQSARSEAGKSPLSISTGRTYSSSHGTLKQLEGVAMKVALLLAALLVPSPLEIAVLAQLPASDVTDADVERLFAGVDQARGYNDLVTILTRHERALVSQRLLDSIDRQLQ